MNSQPAPSAIAHRPSLTVRELDLLDYGAKLRHWTRPDAWKPGGARLRFENTPYGIGDIRIDEGNIVQAKPLVGRPCFGIATAFLRYENATRYVKSRGRQPAGRCHDCKARDACRWVVTKRLRSNKALEMAWTAWLQEGGASAFERPYFDHSHAYQTWQALIRELQRYPFTSVNDQHVIEAYQEKDLIARAADCERKARDRRRARRSGEIDDQDIALLDRARARRGAELLNAARDDNPPKQISRVPHRSLVEMMDVWLGREILRAGQETPTLGKIARWIVATGRSNSSKTNAALETRVSKDLDRITKFEKVPWKGGVLLPPLDRRVEFPSYVEGTSQGMDPLETHSASVGPRV